MSRREFGTWVLIVFEMALIVGFIAFLRIWAES